jgi:tetratricopeptide (TPR) repeat protein
VKTLRALVELSAPRHAGIAMASADHRAMDALDLEARFLACSRRIAENPADAAAYRERALLWVRKQDDDAALADLDVAVSLDPADAHAFALRGLIWESRGDLQRALSDLNTAIGLASDGGELFRSHRDRVLASAAPQRSQGVDRRAPQPSAPPSEGAVPGVPRGEAATDEFLAPLIAACREAGSRSDSFEIALLSHGFGPSGVGPARALYIAFRAAVEAAAGGADPDAPWQMVRGLALDLHHRSLARAATALFDGMLTVAGHTPPTQQMLEALRADKRALRQYVVYPLLQQATKAGRWADALNHVDELLYLETNTEELGRLRVWRGEIAEKRRQQAIMRWSAAIGGVVVALLAAAAVVYWRQPASHPAVAGSPSSPPLAWPAAPPAARADVPPAGLEVPPIAELPLTADNIRYCLFQDVRLQAAKAAVATDAQRIRLDAISADLRQRCRGASFYAMQFSNEVATQRSRLESEGRAMVANWKAAR